MSNILFFPGGVFAGLPPEPEASGYEEIAYAQSALLKRWTRLGRAVQYHLAPLPIGIKIALDDLLHDTE
jgi:hypothetical protein